MSWYIYIQTEKTRNLRDKRLRIALRTYVREQRGIRFLLLVSFFFYHRHSSLSFLFFLFFYFSFFRQESVTCSREKEDCALLVLPSLLPLFTGLFYQQKMIWNKKRRCGIRELAEKRVNACFDSHPVFSRTLLLKICAISFQSEIKRDSVPSHRTRLKERARH